MNPETQTIEYKSLQKIRTGAKGFRELSTTCVALANAQGGKIYIGYDDKIDSLIEDFGLSREDAEGYVWNHTSGMDRLNGLR